MGQTAGAGLKILCGILCIDAHLDRTPRWPDIGGSERGHFACRLFHHPLHKVDARYLFCDAVLYLQARVHFEEIEFTHGIVIDELDRAGRLVVNCFSQPDCRLQ